MNEDKLNALSELKKLLDAGILNETEFAAQKKIILSEAESDNRPEPIQSNDSEEESSSNKKLIWIIVGVVAVIAIIAIVISSDKSDNTNSYKEDDSYQNHSVQTEAYGEPQAPYATENVSEFDQSTVCPYDGIPDDELYEDDYPTSDYYYGY